MLNKIKTRFSFLISQNNAFMCKKNRNKIKKIQNKMKENTENILVKGSLTPINLIFPKVDWEGLDFGQFVIFKADIQNLTTADDLPFEITQGWPPPYKNVCFKGKSCGLSPYSQYTFSARLVFDAKWGYQFNLVTLDKIEDISNDAEFQIFCDSIFSQRVTNLLRHRFDNLQEVLESPDRHELLLSVWGIGAATAKKIIEKYDFNKIFYKDFVVLHGKYGLTLNAINKLKMKFGSSEALIKTLDENPYVLMDEDGYGWAKCDRLALNAGCDPLGRFRVGAYIKYYLQEQAETEGHSWITLDTLLQAIKDNIGEVDLKSLQSWLQIWTNKENNPKIHPWLYYEKESRRIGLMSLRNLEINISSELHRLQLSKSNLLVSGNEISRAIEESETEQGWNYTSEQKDAIVGCFSNGVTIIIGNAGSGKSSIMLPVTKILRRKGVLFSQCSLAGKAASNLSEVTNIEGKTIHRLLGFDPDTRKFSHDKNHPLIDSVIILDELSMVGGVLFYDLLQAIPDGTKLIMLGDSQQLEAIGYANLLKDCVDSHVIPCYRLTKIHRQAQKSAIITESLKVAHGEQIISNSAINETRGELQDLKIVTYNETDESFDVFMHEYKILLQKGVSPNDILGIVPLRTRGQISCLNLNREIQKLVNGDETKAHYNVKRSDASYTLRLGDKVVNRKNRYDTTSYTNSLYDFDDDRPKTPIFNGNVGYITNITTYGIVVDFVQQGQVLIPFGYVDTVELGYVLTTHSAQGSQSPYVVVGLDMGAYTLLSKELLYTQITRARKYCVLCGQIVAIKKAVSISRVKIKQTWLKELLRERFKE